jgi:hypothetical protein
LLLPVAITASKFSNLPSTKVILGKLWCYSDDVLSQKGSKCWSLEDVLFLTLCPELAQIKNHENLLAVYYLLELKQRF